ncbi:MAG: hypothetical protein R2856_30990 [Caldilineaceae bacterium]
MTLRILGGIALLGAFAALMYYSVRATPRLERVRAVINLSPAAPANSQRPPPTRTCAFARSSTTTLRTSPMSTTATPAPWTWIWGWACGSATRRSASGR